MCANGILSMYVPCDVIRTADLSQFGRLLAIVNWAILEKNYATFRRFLVFYKN